MTKHHRNTVRIALGTALILLLIMLMNHFSDEVDWKFGDFVVMGILLFSAGFTYELAARKISNTAYRIVVAIAIGVLFLLIWVELAVGIFGSPLAGS